MTPLIIIYTYILLFTHIIVIITYTNNTSTYGSHLRPSRRQSPATWTPGYLVPGQAHTGKYLAPPPPPPAHTPYERPGHGSTAVQHTRQGHLGLAPHLLGHLRACMEGRPRTLVRLAGRQVGGCTSISNLGTRRMSGGAATLVRQVGGVGARPLVTSVLGIYSRPRTPDTHLE